MILSSIMPAIGYSMAAQAASDPQAFGDKISNIFSPSSSAQSNTDSNLDSRFDELKNYLDEVVRTNSAQLDKNMEYNSQEAAAARRFNAQQAQLNREFQERMSNTAYQRAVQDLMKAGLNPILAFNHNGASTPTGSTASSNAASMSTGGGVNLRDFIYLLSVLTGSTKGLTGAGLNLISSLIDLIPGL